jgi:hypothetical protein
MVRLAHVGNWPIVAALVPENLWDEGLGQLLLARRSPDGQVACGVYMVDVFCLGVKNAFWTLVTTGGLQELWRKMERLGPMKRVAPEYFCKLVLGAVDYAHSLGFSPHSDFRHARLLLRGIDPSLCLEPLVFGKDGQPLYIRGPHESLTQSRLIANRITESGGHYVIPLDDSSAELDFLDDAEGDALMVEDASSVELRG